MTSGIALTKYIYPLETPIIISSELGYTLDNPRTEHEIELIKNYIAPTLKIEEEKSLAEKVVPVYTRIMLNFEYLKQYLSTMPKEQYANKFFKDNEKIEFLELIAKCWIIVRFETTLDIDKILNSPHYLRILSLTEDEKNDYVEKVNQLSSYSQIISLLSYSDERMPYTGDSFLLSTSHPFELFFSFVNQDVIKVLDNFASNLRMLDKELIDKRMIGEYWWLLDMAPLIDWANKIEELIRVNTNIIKNGKQSASQKQAPKDKLLHVGGRLKIAHEHIDQPELPILLLVGNIEYLLTRNPDTNRFNVEDSISRQFKLKCGIAINEADPSIPLKELNEELSRIYSLRSDFAHGNYTKKRDKLDLHKVVIDLFKYTRAILIAYISNKALIDYLKDN